MGKCAFGADRGAPWRDPTNGGRGPSGGPGARALARDQGFVKPVGRVLGCVYPA